MKSTATLLLALSLSATLNVSAADTINVVEPYVRLAPPNAQVTGAFMTLRNSGSKTVKLLKADNPASAITELHTHLNEGGVMKMRAVADIAVPAGGETMLKPGGLHIMLINLKTALKEGDSVPISLSFDDGTTQQVQFLVKRPASAH
jgi:copper(I)-binding protein